MQDFEAIFTSPSDTISEAETKAFEKLVEQAKNTVENIVFCLNSICSTSTLPDVVPDVNNPNISLALEKYFLMFPPSGTIMRNVRFATPIVRLLCQGAELGTMAQFLGKYIKVKKETGMYTLVKLYSFSKALVSASLMVSDGEVKMASKSIRAPRLLHG